MPKAKAVKAAKKKKTDPVAYTPGGSPIFKCKCPHEYQDEKWGKGLRVHTKAAGGWKCTVCNNIRKG